jgi:hypothetical protein
LQDTPKELKPVLEKALWYLEEMEDNSREEIRLMNEIKKFLLYLEE